MLGRGGMALVYLAYDLKHERNVAIKVLQPDVSRLLGPKRFLREIGIAAKLSHPHILPLHDSGEADGILYYVMPYVEGESLRDKLRREKALPIEEVLQIAREVSGALDYAHSEGVIHRDIKPENILLSRGVAVVADFGIARAVSVADSGSVTATGLALGTPSYMSPEQAGADPDVDSRTDVYSLGCVVYEMLLDEPPFTGPNSQAVLARHLTDPVPSIRAIRDTVPAPLEAAVTKALAKAPGDRFRTAGLFAAALLETPLESLGGLSTQSQSGSWISRHLLPLVRRKTHPSTETSRGGLRLWQAGAAFVAVIVAAAALLLSPDSATDTAEGAVLGVAVFPFRGLNPEGGEWSEALGDLLATALDGTSGVRVADPWSLWRPLRLNQDSDLRVPDLVEALSGLDFFTALPDSLEEKLEEAVATTWPQ